MRGLVAGFAGGVVGATVVGATVVGVAAVGVVEADAGFAGEFFAT